MVGYLYDKNKRIGLKTDIIWVEEQLTPHIHFVNLQLKVELKRIEIYVSF
jgi:hypothetical protein